MEGACDPSNPPVAPLLQPLQLNLRLSHWRVFTQCALTIELPDDVIAIRSSSASGRFQPQCVLSLPLSLSLSLSLSISLYHDMSKHLAWMGPSLARCRKQKTQPSILADIRGLSTEYPVEFWGQA